MNEIGRAIGYIENHTPMDIGECMIKALEKQLNNGWIPCSRELPKEYLCKDGEYDPSDYVLVQLDNEHMKTSRYWNHRRCKDTIIKQPWLDLEMWETVIAWQPLPESYES